MVCVVCSCCATSPYREVCRTRGEIGSVETLCHNIYDARHITTVSLAINTYCTMDGHISCAPRTVGPRVQFSGVCKQSDWWPASAYSRRPSVISGSSSDWASLNPALANGHQLKRTPLNHLCLRHRRRRFWHATQDCVTPYVDIILQRGRFWAKSAASGSVRWCCFRSCWTVLSHVMQGRPSCLLQSAGGEANKILLASALSSMCIMCPNRVSRHY